MTLRWMVLTSVIAGCGHAPAETRSSPTTSTIASTSTTASTSALVDGGVDVASELREVSARHILVRVGEFPNGKSHTLKQALAIIADVQKRFEAGEDFGELAKKYSEDYSTAKSGGDIGSFSRGKMVKEFEDAVFALEPYEMKVVVTVFGVHLVQRTR